MTKEELKSKWYYRLIKVVYISLIALNLSIIAGVIASQVKIWRAIGRIEGKMDNGILLEIKNIKREMEEMKRCIKLT